MPSPALFMKSFRNGLFMQPASDYTAAAYKVSAVDTNADGSLQVNVVGGRSWHVTSLQEQKGQWMAQIEGIGQAALRPLTPEQAKLHQL
jgi:hypothetical protein